MEGIYPPRVKDLPLAKENRPANIETGRPIRAGKGKDLPQEKPKELAGKSRKLLEQRPVESHMPRYDATKDSQIIEDKDLKRSEILKQPLIDVTNSDKVFEKHVPRHSAISEHMNVLSVLDRVLNTKVELAVGEVIGVSRELSSQLANAIKFIAAS